MGCSDPPLLGVVVVGGRGVRSTPSVFSRGGSLLPSSFADARVVDAVIVSQAQLWIKPLADGSVAAAFVNLDKTKTLTMEAPLSSVGGFHPDAAAHHCKLGKWHSVRCF